MIIRIIFICLMMIGILLPGSGFAEEVGSNNVIIVLDTSGSMNDFMPGTDIKKMDVAQTALLTVMEKISPDTQVGLIVFRSINLPDDWVYPLAPLDLPRLTQAIRSLSPGGNTPLGYYIKKAADRLLEERKKNFGYGTYRLLIVTDGEAQDQNLVDFYTPDVIARGITMDVIGVAMKADHTLATKVHSYRRADDPEALTQALIEVFAEVGGSGDNQEGEDNFKELASIPDGMAQSLLSALTVSGNRPIGASSDDPMNKPLLDPANQTKPSTNTPGPQPSNNTGPWKTIIWIMLAIALIFGLKGGRKKKGRKRRR